MRVDRLVDGLYDGKGVTLQKSKTKAEMVSAENQKHRTTGQHLQHCNRIPISRSGFSSPPLLTPSSLPPTFTLPLASVHAHDKNLCCFSGQLQAKDRERNNNKIPSRWMLLALVAERSNRMVEVGIDSSEHLLSPVTARARCAETEDEEKTSGVVVFFLQEFYGALRDSRVAKTLDAVAEIAQGGCEFANDAVGAVDHCAGFILSEGGGAVDA